MFGKATRAHKDRIKAAEIGRPATRRRVHLCKVYLGGVSDPVLLSRRDGIGRPLRLGAGLNLDKNQGASASGDEIDLALRRFIATRQDPVSLKGKQNSAHELSAHPGTISALLLFLWLPLFRWFRHGDTYLPPALSLRTLLFNNQGSGINPLARHAQLFGHQLRSLFDPVIT